MVVENVNSIVPFNAFTSIPRTFLKTIGMPSVLVNNVLHIHMNRWFVASFGNLGYCVLGEMFYFALAVLGSTNLTFLDQTNLILCIGFIMLCYAKVLAILLQSARMNNLLTELQTHYPITEMEQRVYRVEKHYAQSRLVMRSYAFVQMFMIWCFNLFPFAETLMVYAADGTWNVVLPYLVWYPFNPYRPGLFETLCLSQFWAAYVSAAGILAADMLLCGIVVQICMQFDDLKRRFMELSPKGKLCGDMEMLKENVSRHTEFIKFVQFIY